MGECEVCGRSLRTGRKYCYEHRNTRVDNKFASMSLIERVYLKERMGKCNLILAAILIPLIILGIILSKVFSSFMIFFIIAVFVISIAIRIQTTFKVFITREITLRKPKFVEFAKEYGQVAVKLDDEEEKFKQSVFRR